VTKKKRTPAQKLARQIQADSGKPYTECLAEARRQLAEMDDLSGQGAGPVARWAARTVNPGGLL
jgi:hypothetical protein